MDQIAEVKDRGVQDALNGLLIERLRNRQKENTWMAVPEVIAWENVDGFRFPAPGLRKLHHDIHLDHFLESLPDSMNIDENLLKSKAVECLDQDGSVLKHWRAYKCLYAELDHQGDSYLLNGGNWYRVKRDFVDQINAAVNLIADYDSPLPEYDDDSEGDYIRRISKASPEELAIMDNDPIVYGGGASKIEFCDLLTKQRDLIHIKRYGQSAALSHLFAQGLTSGELFQVDPEFRTALNLKLPLGHQLTDPAKRPQQEEYRVVFAIVSDRSGPLALPFFSRINLKHAARRLEGYGFRVAKAKITVNQSRAMCTRIKSRKRLTKRDAACCFNRCHASRLGPDIQLEVFLMEGHLRSFQPRARNERKCPCPFYSTRF